MEPHFPHLYDSNACLPKLMRELYKLPHEVLNVEDSAQRAQLLFSSLPAPFTCLPLDLDSLLVSNDGVADKAPECLAWILGTMSHKEEPGQIL